MKPPAIITAFVLAWSCLARAQIANQPPAPQWLRVDEGDVLTFHAAFQHDGKLLKAILLIAAGKGAVVRINQSDAGSVAGSDTALPLDVTRFIRAGENHLEIITGAGESRIAARMELNGDLANTRWITTDATWSVRRAKQKEQPAVALGITSGGPDADPFDLKKAFDAYNSWQLAHPGAQSRATDPATFTVTDGFKVELIRSAALDEGSWVALAFDPQGRITLAREKRGLLRLDAKTGAMEVIEDTLLECRGLLYAHGVLFANANNSKGLYRLRDTDGDGRYEEKTELLHTEGGVGHGRNHIKLGPDGDIYIAHGNNVLLPANLAPDSPLKNYADDQALPNPWNGSMFDGNVELPAGHILRLKPDGSRVELIAGGLRNPLDIAFHKDGALFTFDADMERDVGASWYMPTRVVHIVPGADFGWRRGTGRWPSYFADTLPAAVEIGLSSPTGIFFGYGAKFPQAYQDALYCLDWAYGRIIAVHLRPQGASWTGSQETFISGRPMNVTDGCIGPDGAMWFITGGRGTQSGLYRVTSTTKARAVPVALQPLRAVPPAAGSSDPFARQAAVMEMEKNISALRVPDVSAPTAGWEAATRWLVAVRSGRTDLRDAALAAARSFGWDAANLEQRLAVLRVIEVGLARGGADDGKEKRELLAWLEPKWPDAAGSTLLRREMAKLLIRLDSPTVVTRACEFLKTATASEDLLFYPLHLRYLKNGWTTEQRRSAFDALNRAEKLRGASAYFRAIADTRAELAAALTADDSFKLADVIAPPQPAQLSPHALPGHTFKQWKVADLEPLLAQVSAGRSFEQAKAALISTQCVFCHRVSGDNSLPAGVVGPDLTQVSARYGRRDLLMHIIEPSAFIDEKFVSTIIIKTDGTEFLGTIEREDDERVVLKPNPLAKEVIEIGKAQIKERKPSKISTMPPGLLNSLKAPQILDILAWFESAGDPKHKVWQR